MFRIQDHNTFHFHNGVIITNSNQIINVTHNRVVRDVMANNVVKCMVRQIENQKEVIAVKDNIRIVAEILYVQAGVV